MEVGEQIQNFEEFIKGYYYADLMEAARKGETSIVLDFMELAGFSPGLGDELLEQPEEVLKAADVAITNIDLPNETKNIKARVTNLPEDQKVLVRHIRAKHINKLITVEGTVRQKSDVRPQVTSAKFECPSCGNVINVLQIEQKFKEPNRCGCGRKGKFKLLDKELIDAQGMFLEEASKDLEGGEQPKRMNVLLKGDLVTPMSEKKTNPGSNVRIFGMVKEIPIVLKTGGQSTKYDLMIEANYVEGLEEDYTNIEITEEDEEEIQEIAKDKNALKKLSHSLAPGIYGHDRIKEAIVLQFAGGSKKLSKDGVTSRGDIHMLLIGDPGAGKSQLLKRASVVAPKSRYVSGKGTSGAGLTASVVKDEFLSGWSLEAGALVLANRGILMVDELDKMEKEDRSSMHEGLEQQTISISKANIQATLRCETTVLAAANPKFGRFDPYETIDKQIDLPPTLINRFDLIFTIKDLPDEDTDTKLAGFLLEKHQESMEEEKEEEEEKSELISSEILMKYFVYCRQKLRPVLSNAAIKELQDYYVKMRSPGNDEAASMKSVPVTARQLEALVRLAEASAKVRLANEVSKKDAKTAISLLQYCLEQVGLDPDTGKIDIDRITTGITTSDRSKISVVKEIINNLEEKEGKTISMESVISAGEEKGLSEDDIEETIEKLKRSGDLFEPKRGYISKI